MELPAHVLRSQEVTAARSLVDIGEERRLDGGLSHAPHLAREGAGTGEERPGNLLAQSFPSRQTDPCRRESDCPSNAVHSLGETRDPLAQQGQCNPDAMNVVSPWSKEFELQPYSAFEEPLMRARVYTFLYNTSLNGLRKLGKDVSAKHTGVKNAVI